MVVAVERLVGGLRVGGHALLLLPVARLIPATAVAVTGAGASRAAQAPQRITTCTCSVTQHTLSTLWLQHDNE